MTSHRRKRSSIDDDEFEQLYQSICQSQTEDHIPTHLLTKQFSPLNAGKKQILEKGYPSGQSLKATRTLLCSDRSPVCLQRPQWQGGASLCSSNKEVEVPNVNETLANKRLTPRPPDCATDADALRLPDGPFRPTRDGEAARSPSEAEGEPSHDEVSILEDDDFGFRADVVRLPEAGGESEGHDTAAAAEDGLSWASGEEYDAARLCDACVALFQKMHSAKKTKMKKKKKIDYNPMSLSCDQWILKKRRVCRTKQISRGKLWIAIKTITMNAKNCACEPRKTPSACSRLHVFLQRNLLKCKSKEAPVQNRHGKKRRAEDSTFKPQKKNGKMIKTGTGKKKMTKNVLEGSRIIYNESTRKDRPFVLQNSNEDQDQDQDQDPNFDTLLEKTVSPGASVKTEHSWTKRQDCFSETLGNKSCKVSGNSSIFDFPDPSRHFSWLQKGGFKSMLAKMENRQSTVVKESDSSASEGIF
ncbi:uncharacterized protein [Lepisosteus oculatus]|uniref:uncharacterized protein isoform X2 n=1 Tax=Lepisosteus oculatus TaxID=7918 RepID=UPI0035F53006